MTVQRALWPKSLEAETAADAWRRFVTLFIAVFAGSSVILGLLMLAVDPYDSGRFPSLGLVGIVDDNPRTASVSRGRDARFNAAIIGNSHGQLLSPARLTQPVGLRFVQLTVPGTGPREQLAVMRWFVRHHTHIGALVIAVDMGWCTQDASLPISNPFPFWLYAETPWDYLAHVFSTRSLDLGYRRVMLALGRRTASDPAGYWDYEAGRTWAFNPPPAEGSAPPPPAGALYSFPAIAELARRLEDVPSATPVIFVLPPVFFTQLPPAGGADALRLDQCKQALARLVDVRRRSTFLDFLLDTPMTRERENFMDASHYRSGVAMHIEARIAAALAVR